MAPEKKDAPHSPRWHSCSHSWVWRDWQKQHGSVSLWGRNLKKGYLPSFKMTMRTDEGLTTVPWLLDFTLNLAPSPHRYWKVNRDVHLRRAWKRVAWQDIKCFKTRRCRTKTLQQVQKDKANLTKPSEVGLTGRFKWAPIKKELKNPTLPHQTALRREWQQLHIDAASAFIKSMLRQTGLKQTPQTDLWGLEVG